MPKALKLTGCMLNRAKQEATELIMRLLQQYIVALAPATDLRIHKHPKGTSNTTHSKMGSRTAVRLAASPVATLPNSSMSSGLPRLAAASTCPSIQRAGKPVSAWTSNKQVPKTFDMHQGLEDSAVLVLDDSISDKQLHSCINQLEL